MANEKEMTCPKGYIEVVALSTGFYGSGKMGSRIQPEETFFVPQGSRLGAWFRPVNAEDAAKLLPCKKAEKVARKQAAIAASRLAKDPGQLIQTVREQMLANAPLPLPPGKVQADAPPAKK